MRQSNNIPEMTGELSGDRLIQDPNAIAWDTTITVPAKVEAVWPWLGQMGLVSEGKGGWPMPHWFDQFTPKHQIPRDSTDDRWQVRVGDELRDGGPDKAVAVVVERDDEERTILLDSQWKGKKGKPGVHYTWQVVATPGANDQETVLLARTRMENIKRGKLMSIFGPPADRLTMKLLRRGLMDRINAADNPDSYETVEEQNKRYGLVAVSGLAAGLAARRLMKKSPNRMMKAAGSAVVVSSATAIMRKITSRKS